MTAYAKLIPEKHVKILRKEDITFRVETNVVDPKFTWYRNHVELVGKEQELKLFSCEGPAEGWYRVDIEGKDPEDGNDTSMSSTQTYLEIGVDDGTYPPRGCPEFYHHDLEDGTVFSYAHWWVIDDLKNATKQGVDWIASPTDEHILYPCHAAYLSFLVRTFSKVMIQESRNGKILSKDDLTAL